MCSRNLFIVSLVVTYSCFSMVIIPIQVSRVGLLKHLFQSKTDTFWISWYMYDAEAFYDLSIHSISRIC